MYPKGGTCGVVRASTIPLGVLRDPRHGRVL